jgi:hypothetical protein
MVLEIPLTVTTLSLHATVLFSSMPEMSRGAPAAGAGDVVGLALRVDGALVDVRGLRVVVRGVVVAEALLVGVELMIDRTPESWCDAYAAMPPANTSTPTTMSVPTIHHMRLPPPGFGDDVEYGLP